MRRPRPIAMLLWTCTLAALFVTSTALAKPKKAKRKQDKAATAAIESARKMMAQGEREQVEAGIQSLGLLGTPEAVDPLVQRIREGLPPDLLETAIVTLMALGQPNAGPLLHELTSHRRATIRLRAIEALSAINPPGTEQTLVASLSDANPKVRAAAATGLGEIGARGSLNVLFHALDLGNMEASGAIGRLVAPADVKRLLGYLGTVPFHHLGPALGEVIKREDVTEATKLEVVARLEEVGTPEVKGYLTDLLAAAGEGMSPRLSKAMLRAIQEIAE